MRGDRETEGEIWACLARFGGATAKGGGEESWRQRGGGQIEMHGRGREEGDGSDWWDLDPCGSGGGRRFVRNT